MVLKYFTISILWYFLIKIELNETVLWYYDSSMISSFVDVSKNKSMKYRGFRFVVNRSFWEEIENHIDSDDSIVSIDIHGQYNYSEIHLTKESFNMSDEYVSTNRLFWGNLYVFDSYLSFKNSLNAFSCDSAKKIIDESGSIGNVVFKDINRFNMFIWIDQQNQKVTYVTSFPMIDCDEDIKINNSYPLLGKVVAPKILSLLPQKDFKNVIYTYMADRVIPLNKIHLMSFCENKTPVLVYCDTYNDNFDYPSCLLKNIMFTISNTIECKLHMILICIRQTPDQPGNYDKSFVYDIEVDRSFKAVYKLNYTKPIAFHLKDIESDSTSSSGSTVSHVSQVSESEVLENSVVNVLILGLGSIGCAIIDCLIANQNMNINYTLVDNSTVSNEDLKSNNVYTHNDIGRWKTEVIKEYIDYAIENDNNSKNNTRYVEVNVSNITVPTVNSFNRGTVKDLTDLDMFRRLIKSSDVVFSNINNRHTMWAVNLLAKLNDSVCITSSVDESYEVVYQGTSDDESIGFDLGCTFCENNTFYLKTLQPKLSTQKYAREIAKNAYNLLITKNTEGNVEYNQIIGNRFGPSEYSLQQINNCMACSPFINGKLVDSEDMFMNCLQSEGYIISIMKSFENKSNETYKKYADANEDQYSDDTDNEFEVDYGREYDGFKGFKINDTEFDDIEFYDI